MVAQATLNGIPIAEVTPEWRHDPDCDCPMQFHEDHQPGELHYFTCPQRVRQGAHRPPAGGIVVDWDLWKLVDAALLSAGVTVVDRAGRLVAGSATGRVVRPE